MNRLRFTLKSSAESLAFMRAVHARALPEAISNLRVYPPYFRYGPQATCPVDGRSVATMTNMVPYVLQLEPPPLRLPTMHSSSSPAFSLVPRSRGPALPSLVPRPHPRAGGAHCPSPIEAKYVHEHVQFSGNIYAHLKYMVYGRKQTYIRLVQRSPASVGLAQARPNYTNSGA